MKAFNPTDFRQEFPAISDEITYLDSAATALKPHAMIEATQQFYQQDSATVHRSQHQSALSLTVRFEETRQQVADFINAPTADNIIWTRGTTEAINLVAQSYARPRLQTGDEIIVSEAEHHANLIPWLMVAEQTGARVVKLPIGADHLPDLQQLPYLLNDKTRILALGQMSNITGGSPDLAEAIELAHQYNCVVMVDGAQGVVHNPADVQALDIDFYAFSAHKLYGPTGIGVLYGKSELLDKMPAWQGGGKMLTHASFSGFTSHEVPYRFEAGTPNIAGVIGFSAVLSWLEHIDLAEAEAYSQNLATLAENKLAKLPGFRSFRCQQSSLLAFTFDGVHHSDLVTLLAEQGIALRAGQHCAQPLMAALGVKGSLRASFAPYNTENDVDILCSAIAKALELLQD
ncbi:MULTISPECIES: cysteine desulfurase CsdA [Yersinia]|uniref:cysteine desulfurase CsdA n=1 Tax=Yersinia TaxID=629 RepID=UPI0005ABFD0C|nr:MULTISPECIES: cysteine desulfurase CsdA [Yersinia]AJJ20901.1 cysteine desulfurase, catalytic subunit CsdA [Yersinia intermedia]MCW8112894.1 cysteine desulfurase CsdA [Yersinia intermedia]MDA5513028.1 cysteine desulfurase CsdA [Yersinia intermedia]MDA5517742.1 cysteine desulfurase CsdA [Yersinia intermedia]